MSGFLVPGGGSKKQRASISKEISRLLGEPVSPRDKRIWGDVLATIMLREAFKGKFPFMKEILDRTEGKVPDRIAGAEGGPIGMEVIMASLAKVYPAEELAAMNPAVGGDIEVQAIVGPVEEKVDAVVD